VGTEEDHVVKIAAHLARRFVAGGKGIARNEGEGVGQHALLNLASQFQFVFHPLLLHQLGLCLLQLDDLDAERFSQSRTLDGHGGLVGKGLEQRHVAGREAGALRCVHDHQPHPLVLGQ